MRRLRRSPLALLVSLFAVTAAPAIAAGDGQGLTVPDLSTFKPWSTWQGRVSVGQPTHWRSAEGRSTAPSLSLMGDYYFTGSFGLAPQGGLRATSGLIFGPRRLAQSGQPGLAAGTAFSAGTRLFGSTDTAPPYLRDAATENTALPYVGVGYTGLSGLTARGGWAFSADLGLIGQNANGLRPSRAYGTGQNLDDLVRDMRLQPMVQLGVSYAF